MPRLETIKIVDGKGYKIINKEDFDPKAHKEWKEKTTRKRTIKKDN